MDLIKTTCNMCFRRCGIDVYVENDKIIKVAGMKEHPFNALCIKAQAIPELVHSEERLAQPLQNKDGKFREISWDEALDFIAEKLTNVKRRYGARALGMYSGVAFTYSHVEYMARRFCDLYGTPNFASGVSLCYSARVIADKLTFGAHITPHYSAATRCMFIWGHNPPESDPILADTIHGMVGRGAKLVVIDPRETRLAKKADIYAQIRPGTDCALALGILNVIIAEGLYDQTFVKEWTVGFDRLVEHVKDYTPERVEAITWVRAEVIRDMARIYANHKPASISFGVSMDHSTNGIQAIRAIDTLVAITGNLDIQGGNIWAPPLHLKSLRLVEKLPQDAVPGVEYPLFTKYTTEQQLTPLIDQIVTEIPYPIKALLIAGANPALTWPNSNKFIRGRDNLDLLVVVDIFMTDTAKVADIVLPGTCFWERQELRPYSGRGLPLITLANRAVKSSGNAMEESMMMAELGRRMGYAEYFPWKDTDELFEYLFEGHNISLAQVKQNPGGFYYAERAFQKYLGNGFDTPSGKVEIYSELMAEYGYDPLPTFHEPTESLVSCPDLAEKYPLMFLSGPKTVAYVHSQYRNLPSLRRLVPEPLLEINPQTAGGLDIVNGDLVTVESLRGSIKVKVRLTEDIHPRVVAMQHGWSSANANCLTDDKEQDPVSGYPGFRSVLCRIVKADGQLS